MKTIFFLALIVNFSLIAFSQNKGPVLTFSETSHDFGDITQGDKVEHIFKFENTGTDPLIISDVVTTCGCTATKWNKEPILPGKAAEIVATFNSEGKEGRKNNVITIISNASNSPNRITMITNVIQPTKH